MTVETSDGNGYGLAEAKDATEKRDGVESEQDEVLVLLTPCGGVASQRCFQQGNTATALALHAQNSITK
jgi:hypothetical protein